MSKMNRRDFLKSSGVVAAIPVMGTAADAQAIETFDNNTRVNLSYPTARVANLGELPINKAIAFNYPDSDSPCALIRMGYEVSGGIGPKKDIVAYSIRCNHMGCPLVYAAESRTFKCPCHFSIFDSEKAGQMVSGQATENLPRIRLFYDQSSGNIKAIGVDGLIYGRQANVL